LKALLIFLVGLVLVFGALALLISMSGEPKRVFVVIDSSFPMRQVWNQVPGTLDDIESQGYSEFALATEKDSVHSWQERPQFRDANAFAPCDFSRIDAYREATEADELVLITTGGSCPTDALADWRVITLQP